MPAPLFLTGTARSGTNLLARMLSAHPDVHLAVDPYLPLFKSFRNAALRHAPDPEARALDPGLPFQDYYYTRQRIRALDAVQAASLDLPFEPSEWEPFLAASVARCGQECPDLAPHLTGLRGPTYRAMFDRALELLARARSLEGRRWVGMKEVWTTEFFPPLARAYPEARFLLILRDPRAVVASMRAIVRQDPSQVAHALSYARHWRKDVAFALRYSRHRDLASRFHVVLYEDLVRTPEAVARQACRLLGVPFDAAMLEPSKFTDQATGAAWTGNSSFEPASPGFVASRIERWRKELSPRTIELIDFVCGPDMALHGYAPVASPSPDSRSLLRAFLEGNEAHASWRSDLGDVQQDLGFELFRRALLQSDAVPDPDTLRRSFLFEDVYEELRKRGAGA